MEKNTLRAGKAETRDYVIWRVFPEQEQRLVAASVENGLKPRELDRSFAVYRLTRRELREILGEYLRDGDDKELGPQVIIPEGKGGGVLEGYDLPKDTFAVSVDVPLSIAEYAGNLNAVPNVGVHDRRQAERLIGADRLRAYTGEGPHPVNVVIIDGGLDEEYLRALGYAKPLTRVGGSRPFGTGLNKAPAQRHANAVARNILALAPQARIFDLNLLPDRINRVDVYASDLALPLISLGGSIAKSRRNASWLVVCAWGLMDTDYDLDLGNFARSRFHLLSLLFSYIVARGADVVFSAGNNGLFWPDVFSGALDRGPGRSIYGTNGLEEVLTVGAVDALGRWSGTSSQGPEPAGLRFHPGRQARKPDVCAPSGFYENDDRHAAINGTSGACAVAAGVVAAIRQKIPQSELSSADLIELIRRTAIRNGVLDGDRRRTPAEWRLGSGIIDAAALADALEPRFP